MPVTATFNFLQRPLSSPALVSTQRRPTPRGRSFGLLSPALQRVHETKQWLRQTAAAERAVSRSSYKAVEKLYKAKQLSFRPRLAAPKLTLRGGVPHHPSLAGFWRDERLTDFAGSVSSLARCRFLLFP